MIFTYIKICIFVSLFLYTLGFSYPFNLDKLKCHTIFCTKEQTFKYLFILLTQIYVFLTIQTHSDRTYYSLIILRHLVFTEDHFAITFPKFHLVVFSNYNFFLLRSAKN